MIIYIDNIKEPKFFSNYYQFTKWFEKEHKHHGVWKRNRKFKKELTKTMRKKNAHLKGAK